MRQDMQILPIAEEHIEGFHRCLDLVARERLYLALLQAPPLEAMRASVLADIAGHMLRFVALIDNDVVGWCDVRPFKREGFQHRGELGMGVHPRYRRSALGTYHGPGWQRLRFARPSLLAPGPWAAAPWSRGRPRTPIGSGWPSPHDRRFAEPAPRATAGARVARGGPPTGPWCAGPRGDR